MSNWTPQQFREYATRRLAQEQRLRERLQSHAKNHNPPAGIPAAVAEPPARSALVSDPPREAPCGSGGPSRLTIRYIVRSRRPMDFDNANTKFATDVLVKAGILPRDGWDILQGTITTEKADSAADEGTTIMIEQL